MATLHSAGLHEPTGLQYLIDEGLLPKDAISTSYKWSQQPYIDRQGSLAIEEILRVDQCVIWSRNGSIRRVFNLDIEAETILHAFATSFLPASDSLTEPLQPKEAALVVVLKTQAHIFCLSGAIHVVPLSFEVARALPFSYGCILQPKSSSDEGASRAIESSTFLLTSTSSAVPGASFPHHDLPESRKLDNRTSRKLPTYCITDLLSEVGLVAASYARKPRDRGDCPLMSSDEEIMFVSNDGMLRHETFNSACVAVSLNRIASTFTIWQVENQSSNLPTTKGKPGPAKYRKRQSSNIYDRSRVTNTRGHPDPPEETIGGLMKSFVEEGPKPQFSQLSNIENLAAELGQDFEQTGVQTRSARRISSMLARTDLAPATDRSAFNESTAQSRKSLSRSIRKEGSFGSFTERNSIGGRRSFPATVSIYSNATSFLDAGGRFSLGEDPTKGPDEGDFDVSNAMLKKEITFIKLKSFSCHETSATASIQDLKVLLIPHPKSATQGNSSQSQLSVCVQESRAEQMTVVTITVKKASIDESRSETQSSRPELKAIQIQKGANISDACLVSDGAIHRLLVLSKTLHGDDVLHLEAPWSPSFRLHPPSQYLVHTKDSPMVNTHNRGKDDVGTHRVIESQQVKLSHFLSDFNATHFVASDTSGRNHYLQVVMQPRRALVSRVLEICRFILPTHLQDSLLIAHWEVVRWLEGQQFDDDQGLAALAIVLFTMAVPFINTLLNKPSTPGRRKKAIGKRPSNGLSMSCTSSKCMEDAETSRSTGPWMHNSSWGWMMTYEASGMSSKSPTDQQIPLQMSLDQVSNHVLWLVRCTDLARDFLQSPAGESMNGPEGYLPTAINQDRDLRRTALASVVVALYLLLDDLRLNFLYEETLNNDKVMLASLTIQLSTWLDWQTWVSKLKTDLTVRGQASDQFVFDNSTIDNLDTPPEPFSPSAIFGHIETTIQSRASKYHNLIDLVHNTEELPANHPFVIESARLLPNASFILVLLRGSLSGKYSKDNVSIFSSAMRQNLPEICVKACEAAFPLLRPRTNLTMSFLEKQSFNQSIGNITHHAVRDVRMMCNQALDAENLGRWDVSSETDRQAVTKLLFGQDRRFQEAARLVNQARPPEVEYDPQPNWTEADALEAQKLLAQYATRRTFAVVSGRGLMHFNARTPLLTEMVPRAQFSMQCVLRSKAETEGGQSMTFSADRTLFTEDKVSWAFFHNGASAGLMISKSADFIDTSWILYNKPPELTNRHAGFLFALGLNGHLKTLAKWVAFKYLTPKHTMTSVGLLLGLAASYRGTSDTLITRLLSVHVTCLLPPGAAELNLSPLTQMTGLIGIGLLYHNCQHRRMSDVMISEIETQEPEEKSGDEPILRDEGYRLAAGMSLGLINLGHGLRLHSLHDMRVVERLLAIAVGTKNVNLVHVLDRATAGAVIAIAFIFMKTNDLSIAQKVDIPDTTHQFDYVRPDIFLLRTLARHLIMWDRMQPTFEFVKESLPQSFRHRADLGTVKRLVTNDLPFFHVIAGICFALALRNAGSQRQDARDLLLTYLDQFMRLSRLSALNYDAKVTLNGIRNCLDILALSCATVMAGSGDLDVYRRLRALHGRTDKDTPFGSHLAAHMAIGALFLSGGTATFGTSNLAVASLVIAFYPLFPTDALDNRGHLQALRHLWVLAVEHRCLILRDAESGQVLGNIDATIEMTDETIRSVPVPGLLPDLDQVKAVTVSSNQFWPLRLDFDNLAHPGSKSQSSSQTLRDIYKASSTGVSVTLQRRSLYDTPNVDQFQAELQALDLSRGIVAMGTSNTIPSIMATESALPPTFHGPLDWIFNLQPFKDLDQAERSRTFTVESGRRSDGEGILSETSSILATTPIDTQLELDIGTLGPEELPAHMQKHLRQDKLWQIKLLLAWADLVERDSTSATNNETPENSNQKTIWLRNEFIERLRWRIWAMASGE